MSSHLQQGIFHIDIAKVLTCPICISIIDTPDKYRACIGCGQVICQPCENRLSKPKCPLCRSDRGFARDKIVEKFILSNISEPCIYKGCGKLIIKKSDHVAQCEHKPISCPICNKSTTAHDLYQHIETDRSCVLSQMDEKCEWAHVAATNFTDGIAKCIDYGLPVSIDISANCESKNESARVLYIWMDQNKIVRMFCYERDLNYGADIRLGMSLSTNKNDCRNIGIKVCSKGDIDAKNIREVSYHEFKQFDTFTLGMGVHSFKMGDIYDVMDEDDDWNPARVVQLMKNPMRAVFATNDVRSKIITINLDDTESHKKIRKHNCNSDRGRNRRSRYREISSNEMNDIMQIFIASLTSSSGGGDSS